MPILAFVAGLVAASVLRAARQACRRTLSDLPASNDDWVWY